MRRALIAVDVQNDFCEPGSLPVPGGTRVAERIEIYLRDHAESYKLAVFSKDDHEDNTNGGHFAEEPDFTDTWPAHCVQGTSGNALHYKIRRAIRSLLVPTTIVVKGHGEPAYSAFEGVATGHGVEAGHGLAVALKMFDIDEVDVCGLATDYCVQATALDAARLGFPTRVLVHLTAGVGLETTDRALQTMHHAGIRLENP